ncbi:MAG: ATP-binding protein [Gammaproteobacteria bacterium]|nr:ATP-binding protein [Gammaproteobacteria bacterium]
MMKATRRRTPRSTGKLRIGNHWNAISIIALAQSNPLKAVAEFVENSIDAGARHVTIVRGKEQGEPYLLITDDGEGIRRNVDGEPDFRYVATHICDSFKKGIKAEGTPGIQGEFGIGLLSFWTLGETLYLTSASSNGRNYQMRMDRDDPSYRVKTLRSLLPCEGTELKVKPLLPGIRSFTGEKLEWFLASELRDRIRDSGVLITVIDRQTRKKYSVVPRQFDGKLLHQLPSIPTANGEIYLELYLTDTGRGEVGLYRSGTRVLTSFTELETTANSVWDSGNLEGIVDAPFLTLTPGTRSGLIRDAQFVTFSEALRPLTHHLEQIVEEHRRAEDEHASERMLKRLRRAFREAILSLPVEDYDWFEIHKQVHTATQGEDVSNGADGDDSAESLDDGVIPDDATAGRKQKDFFEFPGPLFSVRISPVSSVVPVGQSHTLRALCRDKSRRTVNDGLKFSWELIEGAAVFETQNDEMLTFTAPGEPGLERIRVTVIQGDISCSDEAAVTITDQLLDHRGGHRSIPTQGLPGYTLEHAPNTLWRSRYDAERNLIVVNNGHRDFVYANRNTALKLRYIARLYAKELVQRNFPGASAGDLLERMIELTLYMEENLR